MLRPYKTTLLDHIVALCFSVLESFPCSCNLHLLYSSRLAKLRGR